MKRQKKQYGRQCTSLGKCFLVPKRFLDEWDDEREDVIGQPNDKPDVAAER